LVEEKERIAEKVWQDIDDLAAELRVESPTSALRDIYRGSQKAGAARKIWRAIRGSFTACLAREDCWC
jgi:hypothetical protein